MGSKRRKIIIRSLKIFGFSIVAILAFMILFPIIFQDAITARIKKELNKNLTSELYFDDSELTFFRHFPSLTLSLDGLDLKGSEPFEQKNFIKAKELSLSIDVFELVTTGRIDIDGIYLIESRINVQVDENGNPNYNVFVEKDESQLKNDSVEEVHLNLDIVQIEDAGLDYHDRSLNLKLKASNFNYKGKGNYIDSDVELRSLVKVGNIDFELENTQYFKDKVIEADLYTKYNSNSLSIIFEENELAVNNLNITFKGYVELLKEGYNVDLEISSQDSRLEDLFTALPPTYVTWKDKTEIKGNMDLQLRLKGSYVEAEKKQPDLFLEFLVDNGSISYQEAPIPLRDIYLDFKTSLPSLDIDQATIIADSISFKLNDDYVYAQMQTKGNPENLQISGWINTDLELGNLVRAIGVNDYELNGNLASDFTIDGTYNPSVALFPKTEGSLNWQNGRLLTPFYPNPISNINVQANILNTDGTNKGTVIKIPQGNFTFEEETFGFAANLENLDDLNYDVTAKGTLNISNIYRVFAVEDLEVDGKIKADLHLKGRQSDATKGNYDRLNNSGTLYLQNIATSSELLPKPFIIREGTFQFHQDEMAFQDFQGEYGSNKMLMNGYLKNVINYTLNDNEILQGKFRLESEKINTDEFILIAEGKTDTIPGAEITEIKTDTTNTEGIIQVPTDLDLVLELQVNSLLYEEIEVKDLQGILAIKDGGLVLKNGQLELIGARALMNGLYKNEGNEKAYFNYAIKLNEYDVKRAYEELELFRVLAPAAENAEGIVSVDYKIEGILDSQMQPVLESLEGGGTLLVKQVKLKGHKMMGAVSSKTQREQLNNPDLSEVEINSSLKNNILNIEQFKFKVKPFKLKMEGQTSLAGDLNLKMRIGLPPFGIIGIPIKVTGTSENPEIGLGKKTKDLEETLAENDSYSELDKAKMAALKDSINTDMSLDEIEALQAKLADMPEEEFYAVKNELPSKEIFIFKIDSLKPTDHTNPVNLKIVALDTIK
ncbi:AsmA-like C-terminal region-containing protein [Gramella lutea]|uniref:AsmA-like C-terminal region-containing protein n=1 Tax=Christiangramia lutea TaxID=1607951 RepID=A0A9X2A965_9FLAO|nr:AsmA-like C-terminal region-containing protein [Christiangramia lutea]MCH4821756.1 AsmA-like C-terminal region-containing protein [Christiangramia lutea]